MTPAWAQRHEKLLNDCIVYPDVFNGYPLKAGQLSVGHGR
jgi:hypothetical protein